MVDKFSPPETCRSCGGAMEAGALKTTREKYLVVDEYPFEELTTGELWYRLELDRTGKYIMYIPQDGPYMVMHYRCTECGHLEAYARGKYLL